MSVMFGADEMRMRLIRTIKGGSFELDGQQTHSLIHTHTVIQFVFFSIKINTLIIRDSDRS